MVGRNTGADQAMWRGQAVNNVYAAVRRILQQRVCHVQATGAGTNNCDIQGHLLVPSPLRVQTLSNDSLCGKFF